MNWRAAAAPALLAAASVLAVLTTVRASDHLDSPRVVADPQADITDVFAFTSPENPARVVLAMTVTPYASTASMFSSQVDYVFRVRRVTAPSPLTIDDTPLDVTCAFDARTPQNVTCSAPGGSRVQAVAGATTGGQSLPPNTMRAFAGLRSDPAFFDRQGARATIASGRASFTGQNAFAGANVLAIVVEIDARSAFLPVLDAAVGGMSGDAAIASQTPAPILAVAAETVRRGQ